MSRPIVYQIGPNGKGGINEVIDSICISELSKEYEFIRISTIKGSSRILPFLIAMFKIWRIKDNENSIAHIHVASKGSYLRKSIVSKVLIKKRIPYIAHIHGAKFREYYKNLSLKKKDKVKKFFEGANKVIVLTTDWIDFTTELCVTNKTTIIPNFTEIPNNIALRNHVDIQFLFLGRIGERKGAFDLINAMNIVINDYQKTNIKLVMCGDGEVQVARKLIEQYQIEKFIKTKGWVSGKEKDDLLRESDVLVLPSYFESFGISLIEGMSYALPIISTNAGSIPSVVKNNEDGILIEAGNTNELANQIIKMADDEFLRLRMGENGRKHAIEEYSKECVSQKLNKLYVSVIKLSD